MTSSNVAPVGKIQLINNDHSVSNSQKSKISRSNSFSFFSSPASTTSTTSWGIQNLLVKNKEQIDPCAQKILEDFKSSHNNSRKAIKQRNIYCVGVGGITVATGLLVRYDEYLSSDHKTIISSLITCAGFALSYFSSTVQSDYSVDLKAERDKLCRTLKEEYEALGQELIVKYVKSTSSKISQEMDEKAKNGNAQQLQDKSRPSESSERQIMIEQATDLLRNRTNIEEVCVERLFIDYSSASDTTKPLFEAALIILNDKVKESSSTIQVIKNTPSISDKPMEAFFNKQKDDHAIRQREIQNEKEKIARREELYQFIEKNKRTVELEIEAEVQKLKEAAALQIDQSGKELLELKAQLEENTNKQLVEVVDKADRALSQALSAQNDAQCLAVNLLEELNKSREETKKANNLIIKLEQKFNQLHDEALTIIEAQSYVLRDFHEIKETDSAHIKELTVQLTNSKPVRSRKKVKKMENLENDNISLSGSARRCLSQNKKAVHSTPSNNVRPQSPYWLP